VNTTFLVARRQDVLDDVATILDAHPGEARELCLDFCLRLIKRMDEGDLDRLRFEIAQKASPPGGETRRAAENDEAATSYAAIVP
jgi:hypothetical protein